MNRDIIEYIRTFILTLIFAFFVALTIFIWLINQVNVEEALRQKNTQEFIDYELVDELINRNKMLSDLKPDDFRINLKLGLLYEIKSDYANAETQYKLAMGKAPYNEFLPQYNLAKLYISIKKYDEATDLMDKISEKPKKKLISYKGDVFYSAGNAYFYEGNYQTALDRYRKALTYYKLLKNGIVIKKLRNDIASCLVYIAQKNIKELNVEDAIENLNEALAIVNAPIIKYNLALLYIYKEPLRANKYFEEVFREEPKIINFNTYYSLLNALAEEAEIDGNYSLAELYKLKMKKIKNFYTTNMLTTEDLKFTDLRKSISRNRLLSKYKFAFIFKIKNTSIYDINSLYLEIIVKENNRTLEKFNQVPVTKESPLLATQSTDFIKVDSEVLKYDKQLPEKLDVEIYASKQNDNNKILISSFSITGADLKKTPIDRFLQKYYLRFLQF